MPPQRLALVGCSATLGGRLNRRTLTWQQNADGGEYYADRPDAE
jgi:hypothetical protein